MRGLGEALIALSVIALLITLVVTAVSWSMFGPVVGVATLVGGLLLSAYVVFKMIFD